MAYAEHVSVSVWDERYQWLRETEEREAGVWGSILISPHGTLVSYDVEIAFCAGAWLSVIVLAHTAIDATLRDVEIGDYRASSKAIFGDDDALQKLRTIRNRLVHVSHPETDADIKESMLNDVAGHHENLESHARDAIKLMYRAIYASPGT